jgi:hypothetical protein
MSTAQTSLPQAKPTTRSTDYKQVFLIDGEQKQFSIPERVYKELDSNIVVPDNGDATHEDILKVATLLFLNYVDAATAKTAMGTGTWGMRDKFIMFQASLIGAEFGKQFRGFAELGVGEQGFLLAGISYKF